MCVVVPIGDAVATFVLEVAGGSKQMTWSIGFTDVAAIDGPAMAETIYESAISGGGGDPSIYYPDNISDDYTFVGVSLSVMTAPGPLVFDHFDPVEGTLTPNFPLPKNCCVLITKRSASGGRKNKGRAYLPPTRFTEADVDANGVLASLYVTSINDSLASFLTLMDTAGYEPVIHHSDGSPGTAITSMDCGSLIATQRRRLR